MFPDTSKIDPPAFHSVISTVIARGLMDACLLNLIINFLPVAVRDSRDRMNSSTMRTRCYDGEKSCH